MHTYTSVPQSYSRIPTQNPRWKHNTRLRWTNHLSVQPFKFRPIGSSHKLRLAEDLGLPSWLVVSPFPIEIQPCHRVFRVNSFKPSSVGIVRVEVCIQRGIPENPTVCIIQQEPSGKIDTRNRVVVLARKRQYRYQTGSSVVDDLPRSDIIGMGSFPGEGIGPFVSLFNGLICECLATGMLTIPNCDRLTVDEADHIVFPVKSSVKGSRPSS